MSLVILPLSALELGTEKVDGSMSFIICNKSKPRLQTCCGVLEFTAEEGVCFLPAWMMALLQVEDGRRVSLRSVGVQKGNFMKLQPHETDFIQLPNPKAILEREMKNYSVVSQGSSISI